jgi:hypothetical protein
MAPFRVRCWRLHLDFDGERFFVGWRCKDGATIAVLVLP